MIPAFALGKCGDFSTSLSPGTIMSLILASNSSIRRAMMDQAGLLYSVEPPRFDEQPVKDEHRGSDAELALRLAEGKALSIASDKDWVIGSDSVVIVDSVRYSKPADREQAAQHLRAFSGRTMHLSSAVAIAKGGRIDWSHCETAILQVRPLSEAFIGAYLDAEWPEVGHCAGVFRMEGPGVTLFERVEGSHFTILGMPLIPLLAALRERGLMAS